MDAADVYTDVLWLWEVFKRAVPLFIFRVFALILLFLLVISPKAQAESILTNGATQAAPIQKQAASIKISTQVVAREAPVIRWPVPLTYISTYFSYHHQGIDIPSRYGQKVYPFEHGKVVSAGWDGGFGKKVVVKHEDGLFTTYAHLSSIQVVKGQPVSTKTTVGNVGTTGYATGAHLHFEIRSKNGAINPLALLP